MLHLNLFLITYLRLTNLIYLFKTFIIIMVYEAIAEFNTKNGNTLCGYVRFFQLNDDSSVRVDIILRGPVKNGKHGIHVHDKPASCLLLSKNAKDCCGMLGGHFNGLIPIWKSGVDGNCHGSYLKNTPRHIGDLCNNIKFIDGLSKFSYYDTLVSLIPGHSHNIVGRSIVIHEDKDDEGLGKNSESLITGNAGTKIDCSTIERSHLSPSGY